MSNEVDIDELLKRILEEEEYVKSQTLNYQEYLPEFIAKAQEDIELIEENALILEKEPDNSEAINGMFRSFHNIKGSSSFVGQDTIQKVSHQTETLLDGCRKGVTKVNKSLIDLILISADIIKQICSDNDLNTDESFLDSVYGHLKNLENEENNTLDQIIEGKLEVKKEENNEFLQDFILEAEDHLESIEGNVLELEKSTDNTEVIHLLFRDFHSIKGLAGFANQTLVQRIAHQTETLLDGYRKGNLKVSKNAIELLLNSVDFIKKICGNIILVKDPEFLEIICNHLKSLEDEEHIQENQVQAEEIVNSELLDDVIFETKEHLENIEAQVIELEKNPDDKEIIHSLFRAFHTIKGLASFVEQSLIQKIAHQTETLMDSCRKDQNKIDKEIVDFILTSADHIKKICENIRIAKDREFIALVNSHLQKLECFGQDEAGDNSDKKIGEILVEQNIISPSDIDDVLEKQKNEYPELKFGEIAIIEEKAKSKDVFTAVKSQQIKQNVAEEYMRIATSKVDSLVDMVGELTIAQSLIEQHASNKYGEDNFFLASLGRMTRITKDLQNISMFLRMVALKSTFQKITRIARDTINELGKDVDFTTSGDETEIDRIVTEKILDPLVHLVKNAISHGIEDNPEERIKSGKLAKGDVRVNAYNKRGSIYIEIIDDGKGIDLEKVRKKAIEKGIADPNIEYSEKEIQEFILLPGFSTLDVANNISGRGVGMDVVKTEISKIGGKIDIKSITGKGSTFTLKIPVNHAIMNGTVVDIEGSNYIIPTVNVKQILQPKEDQWVSVQDIKSMIKVREDIIPLINISKLFKTREIAEEPKLVVIVELEQNYKALPVRNVIGRQEIVVKPVGKEFSALKYVSGMSILGDGKVSLILDIDHLFTREGAS